MRKYKIKIKLKSDALPGSGEGFGAIIDTDIVFDDMGIPFIPAKRIKGCLRESANEVCYWLESSRINNIPFLLTKEKENEYIQYTIVNDVFGRPGQENSSPIYFSNFYIPDYRKNRKALVYFKGEFPSIISKESIVKTFTYLRQQTAIEENTGVAKKGSLRTSRVLKNGILFEGEVRVEKEEIYNLEIIEHILFIACINLRHLGTMRTRGFGEVECKLFHNGNEICLDLKKENG